MFWSRSDNSGEAKPLLVFSKFLSVWPNPRFEMKSFFWIQFSLNEQWYPVHVVILYPLLMRLNVRTPEAFPSFRVRSSSGCRLFVRTSLFCVWFLWLHVSCSRLPFYGDLQAVYQYFQFTRTMTFILTHVSTILRFENMSRIWCRSLQFQRILENEAKRYKSPILQVEIRELSITYVFEHHRPPGRWAAGVSYMSFHPNVNLSPL